METMSGDVLRSGIRGGVLAVLLGLTTTLTSFAANPPATTKPTTKPSEVSAAREGYWKAVAGLRADIVKGIADRDAAERAKPKADLAILAGLAADREALDVRGEIPRWAQSQ